MMVDFAKTTITIINEKDVTIFAKKAPSKTFESLTASENTSEAATAGVLQSMYS